jgi:hypothetical protein
MHEIDPVFAAVLRSNERIGGSRLIEYYEMRLLLPVRDIREAVAALRETDPKERREAMQSVNKSLTRFRSKAKRGVLTEQEANTFTSDIALWFANEVVDGRQSLELQ